jgi:hypothetical protein
VVNEGSLSSKPEGPAAAFAVLALKQAGNGTQLALKRIRPGMQMMIDRA